MSRPIEDVTWQQVMFADISGQLKRYGARPDYFDGCLVKRGIFLGVWLQIVLSTMDAQLGDARYSATVTVITGPTSVPGRIDTRTLEWKVRIAPGSQQFQVVTRTDVPRADYYEMFDGLHVMLGGRLYPYF